MARGRVILVALLCSVAEAKLPIWDPEFFLFTDKQVRRGIDFLCHLAGV